MKKMLIGAALCAAAAVPAVAQTHVSINIGDPGFFGIIDNRGFAAPPVYVRRPVIIERVHYYQEPIYLRAPSRHRHNWGSYCHRYDACGVPVLFVRDDWYRDTYAPRIRHVYRDGYRYRPHYGYRDSYRDGPHHEYRERPRRVVREVVYRDRPPRVVEKVVYRDRPQPVVVQNVVYRDAHTRHVVRDDRHHGGPKHHDRGHGRGHGNGHGRDRD